MKKFMALSILGAFAMASFAFAVPATKTTDTGTTVIGKMTPKPLAKKAANKPASKPVKKAVSKKAN